VKRINQQLESANQDKAKYKRLFEEEKRKRGIKDEDGQLMTGPASAINVGGTLSLKDARI